MNQLFKIFGVVLIFVLIGCEGPTGPIGPTGPAGTPGTGMITWEYAIAEEDATDFLCEVGGVYFVSIVDSRFTEYIWLDIWVRCDSGEKIRIVPYWDDWLGLWLWDFVYMDDTVYFYMVGDPTSMVLIFYGI